MADSKGINRYAAAAGFAAAAIGLRWMIDRWVGDSLALDTLYGAVALAVWLAGVRAAVFVAVAGYLAANLLFIPPRGVLSIGNTQNLIGSLAYFVSCAIIIGFAQVARRAQKQAQRSEAALRSAREKLNVIVDTMATPVVWCGRDLTYRWVSKLHADRLGLPPEKIVGRPLREIDGPEAFDRLRPHYERVLAGHEVRLEHEIDIGNAGPRWYSVVLTPTYGEEGGAPDGWIGVFIDIDARKRSEQALLQADRRKDEFLATLAHELRNPLAPIRNSLAILKLRGSTDPTIETAREMIDRNVQQMVRLIDDLLDVSRITGGTLQLRREQVDLAAVLKQAVEMSHPYLEASSHQLILHLPEPPILLSADPVRLAQVFGNLLNNAAKYTEDGGTIRLSAYLEGDEAVVSVLDNGAGIPPEDLPYLFEKFTRRPTHTERSRDGLGLGLSLVRGLVSLHGGSVTAHSAGPGHGSRFEVRLPVREQAPARSTPPLPHPKAMPAAQGRRILVVDDNRDSVVSLAHMLELMGHVVHTAEDGEAAVETAALVDPDVILLDIGMPKMNGHEAARQIRRGSRGHNALLVALTGWGQKEDKRLAEEAGFDHHLTKPVDPALLQDLLSRTRR